MTLFDFERDDLQHTGDWGDKIVPLNKCHVFSLAVWIINTTCGEMCGEIIKINTDASSSLNDDSTAKNKKNYMHQVDTKFTSSFYFHNFL